MLTFSLIYGIIKYIKRKGEKMENKKYLEQLKKDLELARDFNEMTYIYLEIQRIEKLLGETK